MPGHSQTACRRQSLLLPVMVQVVVHRQLLLLPVMVHRWVGAHKECQTLFSMQADSQRAIMCWFDLMLSLAHWRAVIVS